MVMNWSEQTEARQREISIFVRLTACQDSILASSLALLHSHPPPLTWLSVILTAILLWHLKWEVCHLNCNEVSLPWQKILLLFVSLFLFSLTHKTRKQTEKEKVLKPRPAILHELLKLFNSTTIRALRELAECLCEWACLESDGKSLIKKFTLSGWCGWIKNAGKTWTQKCSKVQTQKLMKNIFLPSRAYRIDKQKRSKQKTSSRAFHFFFNFPLLCH